MHFSIEAVSGPGRVDLGAGGLWGHGQCPVPAGAAAQGSVEGRWPGIYRTAWRAPMQ